MPATEQAQNFRETVAIELMRRRHDRRRPGNITELAQSVGYARETVSRALNRDEFPAVRRKIATYLRLAR